MNNEKSLFLLLVIVCILFGMVLGAFLESKRIYLVPNISEYKKYKNIFDKDFMSGSCPVGIDDWVRDCEGTIYRLSDRYCPSEGGIGKKNCPN